MLDKITPYLLYEIFYFLPNYDIIENLYINKKINSYLKNIIYKEKVIERNHPLVFTKDDKYCITCNIGLYILDDKTKMIKCNHN
jgi:hypothetical protein